MPDVSRETLERLEAYVAVLKRWNAKINLVSPRDIAAIWGRHIADCLQLVPLLPPNPALAVDLGSGAGLPGLVLAIATNRPFHLVESDTRKAAFLREAARTTEAACVIHNDRIEDLQLAGAELVTARALAPLPALLRLAHPILAPPGVLLAPKGRTAETELTSAQRSWHMSVERFPSLTDPSASIFRISNLTPTSPDPSPSPSPRIPP